MRLNYLIRLSEIGIAPRALVVSTREQLIGKTQNTSAIPVPALLDSLEFLSEEMEEEKGIDIPFPIDREGGEYLFIPAVSDFLMEADTLMGNAAVFKATGDTWTIGTGYFDGINYLILVYLQIMKCITTQFPDSLDGEDALNGLIHALLR